MQIHDGCVGYGSSAGGMSRFKQILASKNRMVSYTFKGGGVQGTKEAQHTDAKYIQNATSNPQSQRCMAFMVHGIIRTCPGNIPACFSAISRPTCDPGASKLHGSSTKYMG